MDLSAKDSRNESMLDFGGTFSGSAMSFTLLKNSVTLLNFLVARGVLSPAMASVLLRLYPCLHRLMVVGSTPNPGIIH